jgi:VanZ family protein
MKKVFFNWLPVLAYASLIFLLSSRKIVVPPGTDKVLHVCEYALMGFFTTRAVLLTWDLPKGAGWFLGAILAVLLGVGDEIHQAFVPGRFSSGWDVLADAVGAFAGAAGFFFLGVLLYRSQKLYPHSEDPCG